MFVEAKEQGKGGLAAWFDARARSRPALFTAGLVLLAAAVTIGLLFKTDAAIILYQGF